MFCDSKIAENFQLRKAECGYVIDYGLVPCFCHFCIMACQKQICSHYHLMIVGNCDLHADITIGHGSFILGFIIQYFLDNISWSSFSWSCTISQSLDLESFLEKFTPFNLSKVLQISVGGPNVNIKLFDLLQASRTEAELPILLTGCWGAHALHVAI